MRGALDAIEAAELLRAWTSYTQMSGMHAHAWTHSHGDTNQWVGQHQRIRGQPVTHIIRRGVVASTAFRGVASWIMHLAAAAFASRVVVHSTPKRRVAARTEERDELVRLSQLERTHHERGSSNMPLYWTNLDRGEQQEHHQPADDNKPAGRLHCGLVVLNNMWHEQHMGEQSSRTNARFHRRPTRSDVVTIRLHVREKNAVPANMVCRLHKPHRVHCHTHTHTHTHVTYRNCLASMIMTCITG